MPDLKESWSLHGRHAPAASAAPATGASDVPDGRRPASKKKKASTAVKLGAIGVLSVLVVGFCAATDDDYEEVDADCVDMNNPLPDGSYPIVDDDLCDDNGRTYVGFHGAYGWYYGGVRAGSHIRGGTTLPAGQRADLHAFRQGHPARRVRFPRQQSSGS